jgi:hypothetical protein
MTLEEFKEQVERCRVCRPKLFALSEQDMTASEIDIVRVEQLIGVRLPDDYRGFLAEFGGGDFGMETFFSADSTSDWYLPSKQSEICDYLPKGLIAFSDDGAGGFYAFKVDDGKASNEIYYWNQDGGLVATEYKSVLEFIANYALDKN